MKFLKNTIKKIFLLIKTIYELLNRIIQKPLFALIIIPILVGITIIIITNNNGNKGPEKINVVASIDNPTPFQYSTIHLTVKVTDQDKNPVSGAEIETTINYRSKPRKEPGITNKYGEWKYPIKISSATIGFEVMVDIKARKDKLISNAFTYFTPKSKTERGA